MSGKTRFLTSLRGEQPDRCPLFLRDLTLALDEAGLTTTEVCARRYNGDLSSKAVVGYWRRVGQDAVVGCIHHLGFGVETLGGSMDYPRKGIPNVAVHPFGGESLDRFPDLDMKRDGQFPEVIRSYMTVSKALPDTAVVCNTEGPVTKAAILRGLEALLMDIVSEPGYARELIGYATEMGCDFLEAVAEWSDCLFVAAATDNPDLLGADVFKSHSIPGLKRMVSAADGRNLPSVFHPHGDFSAPENREALECSLSTGIAGFQFAERNDQDAIKDTAGGRVCLMGGIDVHSTLLLGPAERIREETVSCLERFRPWNGYVFMCSGSLHRGMPLHHVDVMTRTVIDTASVVR